MADRLLRMIVPSSDKVLELAAKVEDRRKKKLAARRFTWELGDAAVTK